MFDLSHKQALVTGGNKGIGYGIAAALAEAGASTVLTGRDIEAGTSAVEAITTAGGSARFVACDVNDADAMQALLAEFGGLDILVNNAGISRSDGAVGDMSDETWDAVLQTNLTSVFRLARAAYPLLRTGGGKIINIGSMYSLFGSPFIPNYAASKGGVVQLTKSLAVSWAGDNIQVNAILPGWISTDLTAGVKEMGAFYQQIIDRTPARRFGEPSELGGAAVFLASSASDFVTGQCVTVDGGYSIA